MAQVKRIGSSFSHQISSMSLTDSGKYVCLASDKCTQISREINVQGNFSSREYSYHIVYKMALRFILNYTIYSLYSHNLRALTLRYSLYGIDYTIYDMDHIL